MAHPIGESSNLLLTALEKFEAELVEDSQLFEPLPTPQSICSTILLRAEAPTRDRSGFKYSKLTY